VRINSYSSTKRPRGGEPTTTYSFFVNMEVYEPRPPPVGNMPPYKMVVGVFTKYGREVQDADALWAAVCEALAVQRGAPENLCVHCWKGKGWDKSDTCTTCALGVQHLHEAMGQYGTTPVMEADRKTPRPRQG